MPKIMFNLRPPQGSFGGGAFFVKNMSDYLKNKGFDVVYSLEQDIDLIFIIDPRKGDHKINGLDEILKYKQDNNNCKLLYRVNECDSKREVSINIEPLLVRAIESVDYVVYITEWLKTYFHNKYPQLNKENKGYVVVNGCNDKIFRPLDNMCNVDNIGNPIKLVTHHWSNNYNKGFKVYNALDNFLNLEEYKDMFSLTFIGNYNPRYIPKNIKIIPPTQGEELCKLLNAHDIYLTASINEPCGMHFIEGLSCGLPVLYDTKGGGIVETAKKYGFGFSNMNELLDGLKLIKENYNEYKNKIDYKYLGSARCCDGFYKIITKLI